MNARPFIDSPSLCLDRFTNSSPAYVNNLLASGLDKAALYSKAGDSVWAQSPGFDIAATEVAELSKGFENAAPLQANGLFIQQQKYVCIKADDRSIYGKQGSDGIIAVRTKQALVIAHYNANLQPGAATNYVEKLADYLISVGY